MHSWVYRNRKALRRIYLVARGSAPATDVDRLPWSACPGLVRREPQDVVITPMGSRVRKPRSA